MHNNAMKASEAAQCANEQNKFWQFHDALFEDQSKLDVPSLKATAAKLELDTNKFNDCLDHDKYQAAVQKDLSEATAAGVTGTPAFFINGRVLSGAQPPEAFEEIIDEELTHSGQKQASAEH
jgi:protein-disulfide isomerase